MKRTLSARRMLRAPVADQGSANSRPAKSSYTRLGPNANAASLITISPRIPPPIKIREFIAENGLKHFSIIRVIAITLHFQWQLNAPARAHHLLWYSTSTRRAACHALA
ncbi:hypothetical protein G4G27_06870 [Sphingomonas sp. So64.6b]|uniref:hypothetical protein n=1 Tax=Sphingomonas sp. So64.6b TaxID=2997354 RepID=UPI001602D8E2|nr:hypothetical protein [Sphingomonas sp. So64.6b]QNA83741.1 hypothetical protein G4G27_06870 [Sphingomonas sp. So64.6b]